LVIVIEAPKLAGSELVYGQPGIAAPVENASVATVPAKVSVTVLVCAGLQRPSAVIVWLQTHSPAFVSK
jgi:hypothetical protein